MRNRILVPLVVLVLALAAAGTAAAATGVFESNDSGLDSARDVAERGTGVTQPTTSTPDTSLPDTTLPDNDDDVAGENRTEDTSFVNLADGASQTFAAAQACSVTVQRNGNALTVLSVNAAAGFASEVEQSAGAEVEVQCLNGTTRVDFNAELEDGVVRVRVRVRAPEVPGTTTPDTTVPDNTLPGTTPTTPTTQPNRVDNSGPGNAEDEADDDHSGPGHGGDDAEDDDHSGPGGGDDDSGSDDSGDGGSGPG